MRFLRSLPRRARAAVINVAASLLALGIVAVLVFAFWYPAPFATIAHGTTLFMLLVGINLVLGPALSAFVASPAKPVKELRTDLAVIVVFQVAAFVYGVYTLALARPVLLSFEVDSFRVVTAADIDAGTLGDAPPALRHLSWHGPDLIAAVKPKGGDAQLRAIDMGLAGIELSMEPHNWREWSSQSASAWRSARPLPELLAHYPQVAADAGRIAAAAGQPLDGLRFLPLRAHRADWAAIVAPPEARIVGYLHVDGFY